MDYARRHAGPASPVQIRAVSTVTPSFPNTVIEMPGFATDSAAALAPPEPTFRDSIAPAAYEEAGIGPAQLRPADVYDHTHADRQSAMEGERVLGRVDIVGSGIIKKKQKTKQNGAKEQ